MLEQYTSELLDFIEQQPGWAFLIVFFIAFLESMAIIGVLMPGWVMLLGVGALVGGGVLSFYEMAFAMFLGAVVGEGLSYHVGYYYRDSIRHWRWIESHQVAMERADRFIKNYGVLSLIVGRFIGPLRAILPLMAGISGMGLRLFWGVNVGSGIIWAPAYLIPGILVGASLSLPEGSKEVLGIFFIAETIFIILSRKWWLDSLKVQESKKKQKRFQSLLAGSVAVLLFVILSVSPAGKALYSVLGNVLMVARV
ncbi:DedA family protein [Pleionea sediminis]|uniref:DedA family protein n=1 Tax=Pleionea sediminis TaxID=2569479 RepID=UPI001185CA85|nr:DedA family protein [Pleionea sediminis]